MHLNRVQLVNEETDNDVEAYIQFQAVFSN